MNVLQKAYDNISKNTITGRLKALKELKLFLTQEWNVASLDKDLFREMYEALFKATKNEKEHFDKQTMPNPKSLSGLRLQQCAAVLRAAVEACVELIKKKDVRALTQYFTKILHNDDGELCESLALDCIKALRVLYQYAPHTEHLKQKEWDQIAGLCCTHVSSQLGLDNEEKGEDGVAEGTSRGRAIVLVRENTTRSRRTAGVPQISPAVLSHQSDELLGCLQSLLAAPNSPIQANQEMLLDTLLGFLGSQLTHTRAHQHVFSSLNLVLNVIATGDISLVTRVADEIVPVIGRIWDTKSTGLKNEMVITLMHCLPYIRARIRTPEGKALRNSVENLLETLTSQYIGRLGRDILQLDDITFPSPVRKPEGNSLSIRVIALRTNVQNSHAEQIWMMPCIIASLVKMLDICGEDDKCKDDEVDKGLEDGDVDESRKKRRRIYGQFSEMMRYVRSTGASRKLLALQVIPFLADNKGIDEKQFASILQDLQETCTDESPNITGWALVSIGSCAFLKCASDPLHSKLWIQIWQLCSRLASSQSTSRVACHIMRILITRDLVPYPDISKDIDSMLESIEVLGPASLTDSSMALWCLILERRQSVVHSTRLNPGERLFPWFASKWKPAQIGLYKTLAPAYAFFTEPVEIIDFLSACCGLDPLVVDRYPSRVCGAIGQACNRIAKFRGLRDVLLAEDEETEEEDAIQASSSTPYSGPRKINSGLQLQIVEFLEREVTEVHDRWETLSAQNQGISAAMVQNFVGFIITSSIFVANCTGQSLAKSRALDAKIQETLVPRLMSFLASEDCSQMMIDSMYIAVNGLLPKASSIISSTGTINSLENFRGTTGIVISRISTILSEREKVKEKSHNQPDSIDAMDIDNKVFEFPDNEHKVEKKGSELIREELEAFCSVETFRASTQALIRLCAIALTDEASEDVCGEFVSFLLDTPRARLVMMRPVIEDFLSAARDIFRDSDAFSICEHLPIQLLQGYYIETCEASIALCIDVITALAEKWTSSNQNKNFVETCESVFDHVIKIGLDKMTTSYSIRILISRLLERILTVNSGYRKDHEQAPLTLFIDILQDSDIRVLFLHTQRLHVLFKIYGESSHLNICENIEPKLPSDQEWQEGLAIRVNALGLIALASPPNISRTLYRIYETGQLEKGSKYSARALLTVAKASGLEDARALFKIFSQKLVHAWIPYNDLEDFPASVFGYKNLKEMYNDAPGEMVAQLLVKGNDEGASSVAEILGIGLKELVIREFSKVMAYALTWAIGTPPSHDKGAGEQKPNLVVRIKKLIGDETYKRLFEENFPSIISEIYLLMQMYEDGISETFLPRDAAMGEAYATMQEIIHEGYSERALPLPILPHYKNKYIMGAIQSACTIFSLDEKTELWKPGMVTFIARKLFDTLHPAQGPAHSCGVIRNIRFLICLSGPMVHEGYTLQMLIQGLKPYITDITCAEDTIGVLRYLLRKGNEYLSKHPSFVIGIFLSILAYIRKFSTETMNTAAQQDNQVRSTMGVIQKFHSWLAEHLSKMNFPSLTARQNEAFQAIVESAVGFRHHVNAVKGTKESQLLRHLLDDDMTDDKLLDEVSQRLAFSLFCSSFSRPETFRDDIFGDDQESFVRAKSLLHICRSSGVNDGFLLWSARVLGRAYASTGQLHNEWMLEMELTHSEEFSGSRSLPDMTPKVEILRKLKALLFSDDRSVVTLAEGTLARIIRDEKYLEEVTFTYVLDSDEYSALISSGPPDEKASTPQPLSNFSDLKSPVNVWIRDLTIAICTNITEIPIINNLKEILYKVSGLAEELFPFITHILLARDISQRIILEKEDARISMRIKDIADQKPREVMRKALTELFEQCFRKCVPNTVPHNTILLKTILYLRTQKMEGEMSHADRDRWLPLKFIDAARAASKCKMFKTALLFAEQHSYGYEQPVPVSRSQSRKSITPPVGFERTQEDVPSELLLEIFKNIDDPDSFYGVSQNFNLETVMKNFEYEGDGWNSLSLRGANLESDIRFGASSENESLGIIDALNTLGMNGLSHSFLQSGTITSLSSGRTVDNTYRSAWKLEQWDLPCPTTCDTRSAPIYRALQSVNNTIDSRPVSLHVDPHYLGVMKQITAGTQTGHTLRGGMRTLAMLAEMEEVFVSKDAGQLDEAWIRTQARNSWMETGKYDDVEDIMAMRQATFGSLAKRNHLRVHTCIDEKKARYMEAQALVGCCKMARKHGVLQHALSAATQLNKVVPACKAVGLDISGASTLQAANVLWEQGQGLPSIKMLQALEIDSTLSSQSMVVRRAKLLAKLGGRISEARLDKPDRIMSRYLEKAIIELRQNQTGPEAGRVFHEFAHFCDQQLQNPNSIEDYERALKLRHDKKAEVQELERILIAAKRDAQLCTKEEAKVKRGQVTTLARELSKAQSWLKLDDDEFNRLKDNHDAFLEKSVLNYLNCLEVCDDYDGDAVRFAALWMANSQEPKINQAASILSEVPSRKFVPLMNQISSRLLYTDDDFQRLLTDLITRICVDHPYHGLYQILALLRTSPKDNTSELRYKAVQHIAGSLKGQEKTKKTINALKLTTSAYDRLARAKVPPKEKGVAPNNKIAFFMSGYTDGNWTKRFDREIPSARVPPPTLHINVRADCDYSHLPRITRYGTNVDIASGLSAPKIIKCNATDGRTYKELVKAGQDDLRQDAIMEQVFEQVSVLLQKGRITRQRGLKIRTYKVIPLSANSGVIEFVPNTIPLHDYLIPAHKTYFPNDWTRDECRKVINNVQGKPRETRIREFQRVLAHYQPTMHFFFMHEFHGPDAWFASRLAYTRSTAAISILGHVLGLGDRHGHNILLDKKTGEVIHIDLGVAFEQGRILPVPEVVPFRLTRDTIDGMGITKTEGVFRRCCEFTLQVLRDEAYSIITILDVLRYDPLYSWSMSPLRIKRIQDYQIVEESRSTNTMHSAADEKTKDAEEAEADRALTVVSKKLSKTLSVSATVNELIQVAADERKLALLYSGWAAFA